MIPAHNPDPVLVTWCSPGTTAHQFTASWLHIARFDMVGPGTVDQPAGCGHILRSGSVDVIGGPRVFATRNEMAASALDPAFAHCRWVFMADADMQLPKDIICRLLASAAKLESEGEKVGVIGGLAFAGGQNKPIRPVIRRWIDIDGKNYLRDELDYPRDAVLKVPAAGAACILISTELLAQMYQPHPAGYKTLPDGKLNQYPFFVETTTDEGLPMGEDISFTMRAQALGWGVFIDTSVKTGHVKQTILDETAYDEDRLKRALGAAKDRAERRRCADALTDFVRSHYGDR